MRQRSCGSSILFDETEKSPSRVLDSCESMLDAARLTIPCDQTPSELLKSSV